MSTTKPHYLSLALAVALLLASRGVSTAAEAIASKPSGVPDIAAIFSMLKSRGLVGGTELDPGRDPRIPTPPAGVEVSEYLETAKNTGETVLKGTGWTENFGTNQLLIQVEKFNSGKRQVTFWVVPAQRAGCIVFGLDEYDQAGNFVRSSLWRGTPDLRPFEGPEYPTGLYPSGAEGGVPSNAFLRALDAPRVGATGIVHTQITPYQVVALDVWAESTEQVQVPAGSFQVLKVVMRTDIKSVLRNLPGVFASIIEPFLPKNVLYFEAAPPYRLIKFEGEMDQDAPQMSIELVRSFTAGTDQRADASSRGAASR